MSSNWSLLSRKNGVVFTALLICACIANALRAGNEVAKEARLGSGAGAPALLTGDAVQVNSVVAGTPPTAVLRVVPVPAKVGSYPAGTTIVDNVLSAPHGGFRAWFEFRLSDWDPNGDDIPPLRTWQIEIDSNGLLGSNAVPPNPGVDLTQPAISCGSPSPCVTAYGEAWAKCQNSVCTAAYLDQTGTGPADSWCASTGSGPCVAAQCSQVPIRCAGVYSFGPARPDEGIEYYGATLVLDIPAGAQGTYAVNLSPIGTFLADSVSADIPTLAEIGFVVDIPVLGSCCAADGSCADGVAELDCVEGSYSSDACDARTCVGDTGADNCETATTVTVPVGPRGSPETVTILGDNSLASGTDCLPNLSDLGWWESFRITEAADVTIDTCGTDPVLRPSWAILYSNCSCAGYIPNDSADRTTCGDFNITLTYLSLAAGTYYFPVFTNTDDKRCGNTGDSCSDDSECDPGVPCTNNLHPYQIHISAQQALGSCCTVEGPCTDGVTMSECAGSFANVDCAYRACIAGSGGDDCGVATVVNMPVGSRHEPERVTILGDNSLATGTNCTPPPGDLGWWEAFAITSAAEVTIDYCGTVPVNRPSFAALYHDCACAAFTLNDFFDRGTTCGDSNISMTFLELAPGTYYLPVYTIPGDKRCGDTGDSCSVDEECGEGIPCSDNLHPYQIHVSARAPYDPLLNDDCTDAVDLTGAAFPVGFDTEGATTDGPPIIHTDFHPLGTPAYNDIWYTYTSPSACPLTVSLCEEPFYTDLMVSVYEGLTCPPGAELMSDDESCETCEIISCTGGPGEVTIRADEDAEYMIRVSGFGPTTEGPGVINVYCETDDDGDGVVADVDPDDGVASGEFADDAATFGVVTGTPDTFLIRDVYRPALGVLLIVYGPENATIQACGSTGEFVFAPAPFGPGRHVITCPSGGGAAQAAGGSSIVRLKIGQGDANALFTFPGNVTQSIGVSAGGDATFVETPGGLEVTVDFDSLPGAVSVNGNPISMGTPVNITPPAITDFNASSLSFPIGEEVDFEVSFEDNIGDIDVVTFDFGDDSPDVIVDPATSPTLRSHAYAAAGSYVVTVTVTDVLGNQASEQLNVDVQGLAGTVVWDPATIPMPWPNNNSDSTTRSLRLKVDAPQAATGTAGQDAIKVTMITLQNPNPPNLPQFPPPDFSAYEAGGTCTDPSGCARWVGRPSTFFETQGPPLTGPYRAARLQCTPFYWDWVTETATDPIVVIGAEIVPSSEYSVQTYASSCKGVEGSCTNVSAAVTMYTRRSGDVDAEYNPPSATNQPNAIDVAQLVNKFKNAAGSPNHFRAQLQPNLPELNASINALDIVAVVDSVKGFSYAFPGPCPCPSTVTCGGSCAGCPGMCVKTCIGGDNDGEPCINNNHCPSGTCAAVGTCRDQCGRCNP